MEPNKKILKGVTLVILVMQLFMTTIGIAFLGIYIGNKIDSGSNLMLYLGTLGLFIGMILSGFTIKHVLKMEEKRERRS